MLTAGDALLAAGRATWVLSTPPLSVSIPPAGVWAAVARGTPSIGKAFGRAVLSRPKGAQVKKILELICCILHPIAVFLIWITVWFNKNLNTGQKIVWAIVSIVPFVPFVYVLTGNDFL